MTVDDETRRRSKASDDDGGTQGDPPGDDESIEIIDVTATDEAGVTLVSDDLDISVEDPDPLEGVSVLELEKARTALSTADARLQDAESRAKDLREHLVRTSADFDNFRKRVERDRVDERKQAARELVKNVLPVLDNLDRALMQAEPAAKESPTAAAFVEGVKLIAAQLFDILKGAGLEPVDASGAFDPNVHEALMQEQTTEHPHMAVTGVFEPGYTLGGRLLRPARVKVAWNPEGAAESAGGADDAANQAAE